MAKKLYDAYAGLHVSNSGKKGFTVRYRDKDECAALNQRLKRPHGRWSEHYPRAGWVWHETYATDEAQKHQGPFTSSLKAWRDALVLLK